MYVKEYADNPDFEGYGRLRDAIILQAAEDYRKARRVLAKNPNNINAARTRDEVERFFRSAWYMSLTDIDGEFVLRKLREEKLIE